ncbi:Ras-related protein Rab-9A [Balamuthia mandrillaris]
MQPDKNVFRVLELLSTESFEHLQKWKNDFLIQAAPEMPDSFPFLVVGNKIDLLEGDGDTPGLKREVSSKEAEQWCQENGNMPYVEASAKVGINLDQIFDTVAEKCLMREQTAKRAGYLS